MADPRCPRCGFANCAAYGAVEGDYFKTPDVDGNWPPGDCAPQTYDAPQPGAWRAAAMTRETLQAGEFEPPNSMAEPGVTVRDLGPLTGACLMRAMRNPGLSTEDQISYAVREQLRMQGWG